MHNWVKAGGSLFLIADHLPFAGAADDLAKAFGIKFHSGYALIPNRGGQLTFLKSENTLRDHAITQGINQVATFTGSSFQIETGGQPILVLPPNVVSRKGPQDTAPEPVGGHLQGAVMKYGSGRIAVFGEAAMFSAQLAGPNHAPMGMNAPAARENPTFLLNLMHWLVARD